MIDRPLWKKRIESVWKEVPIAWLSGVRRSEKTTFAQNLRNPKEIFYINCDLPVSEDRIRDSE